MSEPNENTICQQHGKKFKHCGCPMAVTKTNTPHLPQAVTAEPEPVDEQPPFKPGDYVLDETYPEPIYVETIIEDRSYGRLRWLITSDEGSLHNADKCGHFVGDPSDEAFVGINQQIEELNERLDEIEAATGNIDPPPFTTNETAELLDNPGTFITVAECSKVVCHGFIPWIVTDTEGGRHYAKGLRRVEVKGESPPVSPDFTCPACGGKHFGRDTAGDVEGKTVLLESVRCHDQFETGCKWRGQWPSKSYDRQLKNSHWKLTALENEIETFKTLARDRDERITVLTSDRDGARRALAGNIEVTERQLKEQYTTIERLTVLYRAVGDLPTGRNDNGDQPVDCSILRRISVVFDSLRDLKISHLQPGTEADHGTRPTA